VRNITLSVPDDVYRAARIRAAEQGTSLSGLVAAHLRSLAGADVEFQRRLELEERTMATIQAFTAGDRLDRDSVHDRALR
jgi:plasmid stability protein